MPIPVLNPAGHLPVGVHDCTLTEIEEVFGRFHSSDRRVHLFRKLQEFVAIAAETRVLKSIIVDGSFVTRKSDPSDIDLILVVPPDWVMPDVLPPSSYNALRQSWIRRTFGFDALVARDGATEYDEYVEFFQSVKGSELRKGVLRIRPGD